MGRGGGGGYKTRGGGGRFDPTEGVGGGSFSHAEGGGGTNSSGVVLTWYLEVLAILKGAGNKKFPLFKRGVMKCFTLS